MAYIARSKSPPIAVEVPRSAPAALPSSPLPTPRPSRIRDNTESYINDGVEGNRYLFLWQHGLSVVLGIFSLTILSIVVGPSNLWAEGSTVLLIGLWTVVNTVNLIIGLRRGSSSGPQAARAVGASYPLTTSCLVFLTVSVTGGWNSPFAVLLWTGLAAGVTASPEIRINFTPVVVVSILSYVLLYLFSILGNPLPQLALGHPDLLRSVFSITACISAAIRFGWFRGVSITAIEKAASESQAKSRFLAAVSHEMRTPLTTILGWSDIFIQAGFASSEEVGRGLGIIRACGTQLLAVINDILDYSKHKDAPIKIEANVFDLHDAVLSAFRANEILVRPEVSYTLEWLCPDGVRVVSDQFRLTQALHHLLSNAAKFTERGQILLHVSSKAEPDETTLDVTFKIKDTGVGIDDSMMGKLFHPFTQADSSPSRRFGGTGLGLSITKRIVDALGGTITVHSTPQEGATFVMKCNLPVYEAAPRFAAPAEARPEGPLRVLVVEDNQFNQHLLVRALEMAQCQVSAASNGLEALSMAERSPFDLVLMDIQMPVLDGIAATEELRSRGLEAPIIALTANADEETQRLALSAGMTEWLTKPISLAQLKTLVDRFRTPTQPHRFSQKVDK